MSPRSGYYDDKRASLEDLFGAPVELTNGGVCILGRSYPVVDDVIVLLDEARWPPGLRARLDSSGASVGESGTPFAADVQFSFGDEWTTFGDILPEHHEEFRQYFDLVDVAELGPARVCDFGCGSGRWSWFLAPHCREIVLVDFSEAIFVARRNLAARANAIFLMGDVTTVQFRPGAIDFAFSLGVLHHLPVPALDQVRRLGAMAPRLLVYLYYALDNRPFYFRWLLRPVTALRRSVSRIRHHEFRRAFSWSAAAMLYRPFVVAGHLLKPFGLQNHVPLYQTYAGKSLGRIQQDAYDRFFTSIEQRFSRKQIAELRETFTRIVISERAPYWHFLCER